MPGSRSDAEPPDACEAALRLLTRRPHGEQELRRKLARLRCSADQVDLAIARVRGLGYLDDVAFARGVAARRVRTHGPALIAAELASMDVDRQAVREAVSGIGRDELVASARRLAARAADADRRTVAARLLRRGFPGDVVREALGPDPGLEPE